MNCFAPRRDERAEREEGHECRAGGEILDNAHQIFLPRSGCSDHALLIRGSIGGFHRGSLSRASALARMPPGSASGRFTP